MNGICKTLDCFYGTQWTDDDGAAFLAIKVYRDGNPIILDGPFATEGEAEDCATLHHQTDLAANGQFGVGA